MGSLVSHTLRRSIMCAIPKSSQPSGYLFPRASRWASLLLRCRVPVELFHVPEHVMPQNSWFDSRKRVFRSYNDIRAHKTDYRLILSNDLLHSVVSLFPFFVI